MSDHEGDCPLRDILPRRGQSPSWYSYDREAGGAGVSTRRVPQDKNHERGVS